MGTDVEKNVNHLQNLENAKVLHGSAIDETNHLILEIDAKLKGFDAANSDRLKKAEENIQTNANKLDLLDGTTKYVTEQISNIFQTNFTLDEKIQDLSSKTDNQLQNIE